MGTTIQNLYWVPTILSILKLHEYLDIPWWLVFAPIWVVALVILLFHAVERLRVM